MREDGKYLLCFNIYVDSYILIKNKCIIINFAMNYLYKALLGNYPNFQKFTSIIIRLKN